jgi:hypothetical protein
MVTGGELINVMRRISKNHLRSFLSFRPLISAQWGLILLAIILGNLIADSLELIISRPAMVLIGVTAFISIISSYRQERLHRWFVYFLDPLVMMGMSAAVMATWAATFAYSNWALFILVSCGLLFLGLNQANHLMEMPYASHIAVSLIMIYSLVGARILRSGTISLVAALGVITLILCYCLRAVIRPTNVLKLIVCVLGVGLFFDLYGAPWLEQIMPFK